MVECRRVLKWTYTYGYYTFGEQADQPGSVSRIPPARMKQYLDFFEYNQVLTNAMCRICPAHVQHSS